MACNSVRIHGPAIMHAFYDMKNRGLFRFARVLGGELYFLARPLGMLGYRLFGSPDQGLPSFLPHFAPHT
jgi:hypothetical protein